jgi:hypothetical protein
MVDSLMGNTTGQAGVTIKIDISGDGIAFGKVDYIDEGSVLLQNVNISNANIAQKINVVTDGSLVIETSAITDLTVNIVILITLVWWVRLVLLVQLHCRVSQFKALIKLLITEVIRYFQLRQDHRLLRWSLRLTLMN